MSASRLNGFGISGCRGPRRRWLCRRRCVASCHSVAGETCSSAAPAGWLLGGPDCYARISAIPPGSAVGTGQRCAICLLDRFPGVGVVVNTAVAVVTIIPTGVGFYPTMVAPPKSLRWAQGEACQ